MANIAKRPDGRWRARYYDPEGKQHARHFARKIDGERWLTEMQSRINRGDWVAPELARITVSEWAPVWLASKQGLKGRTAKSYDSLWRTLVEPRWGKVRLDAVTHSGVITWVAEMNGRGLSPSRVGQALLSLKQILDLAVLDGRLSKNVAKLVKAPRPKRGEPRYLTHTEVAELAEQCGRSGDQYRMLVLVAAYTGARWGELRALKVHRLDLLRRKVDIFENMPDQADAPELPKNHKRRTVPLPSFLIDDLTALVAGKGRQDLVFTDERGRLLDNTRFRKMVFTPAAEALGLLPLTPHDLRDTAASLAVSADANVKAVQRMLGHASAAMTLDIYSGLFDTDLEDVADRMDQAARQAAQGRPGATIVALPRYPEGATTSDVAADSPFLVPETGTDSGR